MVSKKTFRQLLRWPLLLLAIIWATFIVDTYLLGGHLSYLYGLHTREVAGLIGVITSPFLHGGWAHLLSNSPPFLTLMALLIFFYPRLWPRVLTTLWLGTGISVWAFSRSGVTHIGASGVVYALVGFLAFSGLFRRDFRAIVVSLVVLFYYGGLAAGVVPGQEGISWESHLFGAIVGALAGYAFRNDLEDHELESRRRKAERLRPRAKEHFLDADTFTMTKQERALKAAEERRALELARREAENNAFWKRLERLKEEDRLRDG